MPFVKLDCGILDSTLWQQPPDVRIVWVTLLAMAGADGIIRATAPVIARRAIIPIETVREALEIFMAPDADSRTLAHDGRRLERVETGYLLLNYAQYRANEFGEKLLTGQGDTNRSRGRVYFIRCADAIKIGFSQNPWARLTSLQTALPSKATLIGHIPGSVELEKALHKRFEHLKTTGEWFKATPEIMTYIDSVATSSNLHVATGSDGSPEVEEEVEAEKNKTRRSAKRAFPADADEKGWKKLAEELNVKTIPGEDWNDFKSRIRKAWHGRWGKG